MLSDTSVVSRNPNAASRVLGDEAIVLTPSDSKVHGLNEVGARIWELLADSPDVKRIVATVHAEFDVSEEDARKDVIQFLEALRERNMIVVSDSPGTASQA